MKKKRLPLQEAFNSTFHNKYEFDDFENLNIQNEYVSFSIGKNLILNPSDKLKNYLRFLNSFIFDYSKVNTHVVHSYLKHQSAYTSVEKHKNSKYFFQTDIQKFFYSIKKQDIATIVDNNLNDSPITDIADYREQLINFATVDDSLPIGFSTSPSISNTCLYEFDNALEQYCLENQIIYTRYSDDLILSSESNNLQLVKGIITQLLTNYFDDRLQLNNHKTKLTQKGSKIKLLGMVILPSGKVSVDRKVKTQLEVLLHFYINDKVRFKSYITNVYRGDIATISGQLNYIRTIDPSYLNKLRKRYGNFIIDAFCHQSIKLL